MSASMAAVRVDETLGIRETAEFFGPEGRMLFGLRHLPEGAPRAGILICSPLFADFVKNYRREFELARRLAADGFAVQRFHYRGTGNSDGDAASVTVDTLCADAFAAAARLREEAGVPILGVVGTRLGSLAAAQAAPEVGATGLVLLEPTHDPAAFLREAFRARLLRDLREGASTEGSRDALMRQLEEEGHVDVLGYAIHRTLHRSLLDARLDTGSRPSDRVLLLDHASGSGGTAMLGLAASWRAKGAEVEVETVGGERSWWLATREDEGAGYESSLDERVIRIRGWIDALEGRAER